MKKNLKLLVAVILLTPFLVKASFPTSESFAPGERVSVFVQGEQKEEFFVLKDSLAGEEYVWVILNGNMCAEDPEGGGSGNIPVCNTVFDERDPGPGQSDYDSSQLKVWFTKALAPWENIIDGRPLNMDDLNYYKDDSNNPLIKEGASTHLEIPQSLKFIGTWDARITNILGSEGSSYWTSIPDGNDKAFAMTLNENWSESPDAPVAFLQSYDVEGGADDSARFLMRPVARVHKQYIDCYIDDEGNEVAETTVPANPQTSENAVPYIVLSLGVLSAVLYFNVQNKKVIRKY